MILCCGEALVDFLPRRASDNSVLFAPAAGGSVYNVAVGLGRLGVKAGFVGGLSTDLFGDLIRDGLISSGVDVSLAPVGDRPSTLAFVRLDRGDARYAFFDENSAGRMLSESDLPTMPAATAALHFGSFSLASEPCGSSYEVLMRSESPSRTISLDPNIRPALVADEAAYRSRLARTTALSDIVKLSEEDLAWIAGAARFEDVASRWLEGSTRLVVLTKGSAGAIAVTRRDMVVRPAAPAEIVDTIGAGDAFHAAMLAWLSIEGRLDKDRIASLSAADLAGILDFAGRAAAVAVSRPGADPPWRREVM